ncbi:MAG: hypothetical protein ACKOXB_04335 [Flavobacteriales bacterium]
MSYNINSVSLGSVVLKRAGTAWASAMFIVVGFIFIIISLCVFLFWPDAASPLNFIRIIFLVMGGIGVIAGFNYTSSTKKRIPKWIIFNNDKGYVQVQHADNALESGFIPYEEISDFYVSEESEYSSSSNTRMNNRIYSWHVILRRKDGGTWYLHKSSSPDRANKILEELLKKVNLGKHSQNIPQPWLTDKIHKESTHNKSIIRWKNKLNILTPLVLLGFSVLFFSIGNFILDGFMDDGFVYVVAGFIFCVYLLVMFMIVKKMIKDLRTRYSFSIGRNEFVYSEEDLQGNVRRSENISLSEISGVSLSFNPEKGYQTSGDLFVRGKKEETSVYGKLKKTLGVDGLAMDFSDLTIVEKLEVDRWIKKTIKEKSGIEVV